MVKNDRLLLIGGSRQNVGKTTFACDLLNYFSSFNDIVYIKTSSHFHGVEDCDIIIFQDENITITEETELNRSKDTSRVLKAGARKSFFVQAKDEFVLRAYEILLEKNIDKSLIICESASLRNYVIPHFFIALVIDKNGNLSSNKKILQKADIFIEKYLTEPNNIIEEVIDIEKNSWKIKQ